MMTTCLSIPNHGDELRDHLCTMYREQILCDMVLVAEGGAEFPLHKTVLHAFSQAMKTQYSATYSLPDRVEFLDVSAQSVGVLLDFIYSGTMYVNNDTVWTMLTAASRLQIPSAIKLCNKLISSWSEVPKNDTEVQASTSSTSQEEPVETPDIKTEVQEEEEGEEEEEEEEPSLNVTPATPDVPDLPEDDDDNNDVPFVDDPRDEDFKPEVEQQRTVGRKSKRISERMAAKTPQKAGRRKKSTPIPTSKRLKKSKGDSPVAASKSDSPVTPSKTVTPLADSQSKSTEPRINLKKASQDLGINLKKVTPGDDFHVACKQCDKMFAHYSTMHLHRRVHGQKNMSAAEKFAINTYKHFHRTDTGRYMCRDCQQDFNYYSDFARHYSLKHKVFKPIRMNKKFKKTKSLFRCNFCSAQFVHKKTADGHQEKCHPNHLRCRHCGKVFTKPKEYKAHLSAHGLSRSQVKLEQTHPGQVPLRITDYMLHPNTRLKCRYICPFCLNSYPSEDYLDKHVVMRHGIPVPWESKIPKACPQEGCDFEGKTRLEVMMHMNSVHRKKKGEQPNKAINRNRVEGQRRRQKNESGRYMKGLILKVGKQLRCSQCSFVTSENRYNRIYRHVYNQHQEKSYHCDECDSSFYLRYQLKRHKRHSHGEKKVCPTCGAHISPRSLKQHMVSHGKLYECKDCREFFASAKNLKEHDKEFHKSTQFKCCGCDDHFPYRLVLIEHESQCEAALVCQACGKRFSSQRNKKRHHELCRAGKPASEGSVDGVAIKEEPTNRNVRCQECGFRTTDEGKLHRHMYHRHREKKHICPYCGMSYCVKSDLSKHLRSHAAREPCPICEELYSSRTISRHVLGAHGKDNYHYCKDCMKCFSSDEVLKDHIVKSHKHSCRGCKKLFLSKYTLRDHYKACDLALTCQECNMKFGTIHVVKRHIANVHDSIGSVCDQCGAFFKTGQALRCHIEKHKVDPNMKLKIPTIQCEYCSFKAISTSSVLSHYTRMHREKRHVCPTCGKEYAIPSDLTKHMKAHAPPVTCPICFKVLSHKSVANHIRLLHGEENIHFCGDCVIHFETAEKRKEHDREEHIAKQPYHCKGCFLVFAYKAPMKEHMRTCEMALTCTQCGVPQQSKHALDKHINRVHGERNFICEVCGTKFLYASELNKHLQKKHDYIIVNITEAGPTPETKGMRVTRVPVAGLDQSRIAVLSGIAAGENALAVDKEEPLSEEESMMVADPAAIAAHQIQQVDHDTMAANEIHLDASVIEGEIHINPDMVHPNEILVAPMEMGTTEIHVAPHMISGNEIYVDASMLGANETTYCIVTDSGLIEAKQEEIE